MYNPKEVEAMIKLLDDSDEEIFRHVEQKLLGLGEEIIPVLETFWENSFDALLQHRIEILIHKIQFKEVRKELNEWALSGSFDLLRGFIIISKYQYPDLDEQKIIDKIEAIKRDAWIQLSFNMSPLEKIKVLNHVFYSIYGFSGNTVNYKDPQNSYINIVLETHRGNQISLAIIYSVIAQRLDIPVFGVNLPQHFILAYKDINDVNNSDMEVPSNGIWFYINAFNKGFVFHRRDIDYFLKQLNLKPEKIYYEPCSNRDIIKRVIRNLINSYEGMGSVEKAEELKLLMDDLD